MTPSKRPIEPAPGLILYHAECADGFGAAWALWKRFPSAQFRPVKHGLPPPLTPTELTGQHILIVDFSYPRPILEEIHSQAASLLVLDHHITAQKALAGLPYARFDQKKSGAVMAWEWTHHKPIPWLLRYIQDKDLWQWALRGSREVNAALGSYPYDFRIWDKLTKKVLLTEGKAILRYESELVDKIAEEAVLVSFHGHTVPAVYSSILTSQMGERLANGVPFCIIWHERNGRRYFSLRSQEGGADVGTIATAYGGGGHTHAAGFSIPMGGSNLSPTDSSVSGPRMQSIFSQAKKAS